MSNPTYHGSMQELILDMCNRIETRLNENQWKPISTVPKDGTVIEMKWDDENCTSFLRWVEAGEADHENNFGWQSASDGGFMYEGMAWREAGPLWQNE